eukprot:6200790-Pleurochrysis_carterae.AAC.2
MPPSRAQGTSHVNGCERNVRAARIRISERTNVVQYDRRCTRGSAVEESCVVFSRLSEVLPHETRYPRLDFHDRYIATDFAILFCYGRPIVAISRQQPYTHVWALALRRSYDYRRRLSKIQIKFSTSAQFTGFVLDQFPAS